MGWCMGSTLQSSGMRVFSVCRRSIHSGWKGRVWIHLVAVHLVPASTGQPVCMLATSLSPSGFRL